MAVLAHPDFGAKSREFKLRALLEDFVEPYQGVRPGYQLALAVWFGKSLDSDNQNLLALFTTEMNEIGKEQPRSLLWKTDAPGPPYVTLYWTSVRHFSEELQRNPSSLQPFLERFEVLDFDTQLIDQRIQRAFNVITEPPGLLKGWYISADQFEKTKTVRNLLSLYAQVGPHIGLVKVDESRDFEDCRGLLQVEVAQRWVPVSPGGA